MSDHELGVKMVEEEETLLFLEAYEASTETRLEIEARTERPDFICRHEAVGPIGAELALE